VRFSCRAEAIIPWSPLRAFLLRELLEEGVGLYETREPCSTRRDPHRRTWAMVGSANPMTVAAPELRDQRACSAGSFSRMWLGSSKVGSARPNRSALRTSCKAFAKRLLEEPAGRSRPSCERYVRFGSSETRSAAPWREDRRSSCNAPGTAKELRRRTDMRWDQSHPRFLRAGRRRPSGLPKDGAGSSRARSATRSAWTKRPHCSSPS